MTRIMFFYNTYIRHTIVSNTRGRDAWLSGNAFVWYFHCVFCAAVDSLRDPSASSTEASQQHHPRPHRQHR
jgi:hypothetical protein